MQPKALALPKTIKAAPKAPVIFVPRGRLGQRIEGEADASGISIDKLTVLSPGLDPYRFDNAAGHRNGAWFAEQVARVVREGAAVHLRGLFYCEQSRHPDGSVRPLAALPWQDGNRRPERDEATAVLLVAGQSNAANSQGQRYQSPDDRVVNFSEGHCYRAASPLLGADDHNGESWTLLGLKLIQTGLYTRVIVIPAASGGSAIRRWTTGGDLNAMLMTVISAAKSRYTITAVLWDQGATDFTLQTPEERYRSDLKALIDQIRAEGVTAPCFITRCSVGGENWTEDNAIARAQAALADGKTIFDGPNTDRDVPRSDRYDEYHFAASGQEKWTDTWVQLLRAHR